MKTVLLFGTFDFLHVGHLHVLREAKKLGERLVVCVARDEAIATLKGKAPLHTEEERKELISHIDIVDTAFLGDTELGRYSFFEWMIPDVIVFGYDQQALYDDLSQFLDARHIDSIKCVQLDAYPKGQITTTTTIKHSLGL